MRSTAQIERSPSFFDGRPVVLDLGALPSEQPDVAGLLQRLNQPRHPHHRHRRRAPILAGAGSLGAAARHRHAPGARGRRAR